MYELEMRSIHLLSNHIIKSTIFPILSISIGLQLSYGDGSDMSSPPSKVVQVLALFFEKGAHLVPAEVEAQVCNGEFIAHEESACFESFVGQLAHTYDLLLGTRQLLFSYFCQFVGLEDQHSD
jgi:hypothetical protein